MVQSTKTSVAFHHFHPLVEVDLPPFVNYFHPKMDLILDKEAFISTLIGFPRLSSSDPSNMVYQLLQDCFVHDDFANGFVFFFIDMQARCLWSCSSINITFICCITIIVFRKTSWKRLIHRD
jgi:hypothetical protein